MQSQDKAFNERRALIQVIQMLGIDPMSMGPICYKVLTRDLKRRFRDYGYHQTLELIGRITPHIKLANRRNRKRHSE